MSDWDANVREATPPLFDGGTVTRYRKKPVVVEALQLRWDTWNVMCDFITSNGGEFGYAPHQFRGVYLHDEEPGWAEDFLSGDRARIGLLIPTLEGQMLASEYDYVIRGVAGEFYPCKPAIFEQTYEYDYEEVP